MEIENITDRESLERWLKDRPREDAIAIAYRSAMRVAPLCFAAIGKDWVRKRDLTALPVLRANLTSGVARKRPSPKVSAAAFYAASAAASAAAFRVFASAAYAYASDAASDAAASAYASDAASAASDAAASASAASASDASDADALIWLQVREDARLLMSGNDPLTRPLWSIAQPDWFAAADKSGRAIWALAPDIWDFWTRWWDGVLSGDNLPWELQEKVALIKNRDWKKGPAHIAEVIRGIEAEFVRALTSNGERIVINSATNRAMLVSESELPDDISLYARRKLSRALGIFGDELANQYAPITPALDVVRLALDDAASLPVELFDACASALRMTTTLVRNEVVPRPEQDAKINEFVTQLREVGADILGHDSKTQDILKRRNEITGNNALLENRDVILDQTAQLAEVSEGPLVRILERDGDLATNPAADPEDRHDASFRLAGKMLRFAGWAVAAPAAVGAVIAGGKEVYWLGEKVVASPQFQTVIEAIMRWLGFG